MYSWGVNSYGQTGIAENAGEKEAVTLGSTVIKSVWSHGRVTGIAGVNHHRIAVIEDGECLVWGRLDSYTAGLKIDCLPTEDIIRDSRGNSKILTVPICLQREATIVLPLQRTIGLSAGVSMSIVRLDKRLRTMLSALHLPMILRFEERGLYRLALEDNTTYWQGNEYMPVTNGNH